jgi:hypothetical protein
MFFRIVKVIPTLFINQVFLERCRSWVNYHYGELAQLARASALHAEGHRFDSDILHRGNWFNGAAEY